MNQVRESLLCENTEVDGSGVRIAVLDTGVDIDHPDLTDRINQTDSRAFGHSRGLMDRHGHGTHVAGIIAGTGAASEGRYRGIAPGAELVVIKISEGGTGYSHDVAAGVQYALELDVDIINYSGGTQPYHIGPPPWKWPTKLNIRDRSFVAASERGVLCVAAAGNEGPEDGTVIRPGSLEKVLSVGATALPENMVADRSGRGPVYLDSRIKGPARADLLSDSPSKLIKPDVVVPGGDGLPLHERQMDPLSSLGIETHGVTSARSRNSALLGIPPDDPDSRYTRIAGTSQATAIVTGLAALLLEKGRRVGMNWGPNPGSTVRELLKHAARLPKQGRKEDYGNGVLTWPLLIATLSDFINNAQFRTTILEGPQLRLEP